jgi:hypothetical protein
MVILGLLLTGTSKLQRMMSNDPGVQSLTLWRLLNPAPFPRSGCATDEPRIRAALEYEQMLGQLAPEFMAAHPTLALEPDEEAYLLDMSFECLFPQLRTRVPSYASWLSKQSGEVPYTFLVRMLKYLQWQDGGHRGHPWILKSPLHLGKFATLARTFPDATFVHCHRDLSEVLPSCCRMVETARKIVTTSLDLRTLGTEMLELWSQAMDSYLRDLAQLRCSTGVRVLDVEYSEITTDSVEVIERIHAHRGSSVTDEARASFRSWGEANPPHRHGENKYTLERYGLDGARICDAFSAYLESRQ